MCSDIDAFYRVQFRGGESCRVVAVKEPVPWEARFHADVWRRPVQLHLGPVRLHKVAHLNVVLALGQSDPSFRVARWMTPAVIHHQPAIHVDPRAIQRFGAEGVLASLSRLNLSPPNDAEAEVGVHPIARPNTLVNAHHFGSAEPHGVFVVILVVPAHQSVLRPRHGVQDGRAYRRSSPVGVAAQSRDRTMSSLRTR